MNANRQFVVDASVAVKWFVPEVHSSEALSLRASGVPLCAPDILLSEVANVFLKKIRRAEMPEEAASKDLEVLPDQVTLDSSELLLMAAFSLALQHGRSFYDSLYVALALEQGCQLITADERLCNSLRPAFGDTLIWLGELPATLV